MSEEIWKDIPAYRGKYSVSSAGRVRANFGKHKGYPKIISGNIISSGYRHITLCIDSREDRKSIHRLVMETFFPEGRHLFVNHKNGIKTDNRIENLEWCTMQHNTQHAFDTGLAKPMLGSKHPMAKITEEDAKAIVSMRRAGYKGCELAAEFGISQQSVCDIVHGRTWLHVTAKNGVAA